MKLINYFSRKKSADMAKSRLQIIIAQQRAVGDDGPDYLPQLKEEILRVVQKYVGADLEKVKVDFQTRDNNSIVELNVQLPASRKGRVVDDCNLEANGKECSDNKPKMHNNKKLKRSGQRRKNK